MPVHTGEAVCQETKDYLVRFGQILDNMIKGMRSAELTDSVSHNFIVQMIPHHEGAIEMSRSILRYTNCVPLREIANNIIISQTKSLADMQAILCACSACRNPRQDIACYQRRFEQIVRAMADEMQSACRTDNMSADFMREMIPHHRGAIRMSENALQYSICPALRPILQEIITSQRTEIRKMTILLRCITRG